MEDINAKTYKFDWGKEYYGVQMQHFNTARHIQYLRWFKEQKQPCYKELPIPVQRYITFLIGK